MHGYEGAFAHGVVERSAATAAAQVIGRSQRRASGASRGRAMTTESLERRQMLSATSTDVLLSAASAPAAATTVSYAPQATGDAGPVSIDNQSQTHVTLTDSTATMTGRSELHITGTASPIANSIIHLNSPDAWFFMDNVKPSVVNSTYLSQIRVNGAAAVHGLNVRVVQYGLGTVVIPHAPSYQPLTTYTGPNFTGTAKGYNQYTYYDNANALGTQNRAISSFKLKRGYMATVATQTNGSGSSKVYVAQDHDLDVSLLTSDLDNAIQFVRVLPWRWVPKKGASDLSPTTLDAGWYYNWDNNQESSLDAEYVPIRQQRWWPGLPHNKQNVTHLLGYNEPNNPVEDAYETLGNGSIDMAISLWPELLSTGLRVGSPAVTDGGKAWLYEFMDKAIAANLRVDYIAIHNYQAGNTATSLYNWLKDIYDRYQLPIWITEFNNGANWTGGADPTYAQNASAISSFIDMFDNTPWIERYSIYSRVEAVREMTYADGSLTPAGVAYKNNASPIAHVQEAPTTNDTQGRSITRLPLDGSTLDASGFGNNGEAAGAPTFIAGQVNQALSFDGTDDYLRLSTNVANRNEFTFAGWVNWDGGANWQRIFDFGNGTNNYAFLTPSNGSSMRFAIKNGGAEQVVTTTPLPVGQWTHVAVTLGGGSAKLYVNGNLVATNNAVTIRPGDFDPTINYIGKSQFAADPLFKGRLDEVQITDSALSQAQIVALMTNAAPIVASAAISRGPALRGSSFSGTIAGLATDADAGDSITYGKANGPSWLIVSPNGSLSGTPTSADLGIQEFVVTATDSRGATTFAILTIEMGETYWRGDVSNVWNANNSGNTNWSSDAAGNTDTNAVPNASTDVVFAAGTAGNLPGTVLGGDTSVRSIRVNTPTGVSIGGSHNLTIAADGLTVVAGAGATTISTTGQVILGSNQTWTIDSANGTSVTSVVSGTAGLTKAGSGTLTLAGNNLYTGTTVVAAGTLQIGNGGTSGSIAGNINNNGTLIVNRSNDLVLNGSITGTGSLSKIGAGRLTLNGVSSFSGGATIGSFTGAGVLRANANNALGSGDVTVGPGGNATSARLELAGGITLSNLITLPQRNNGSVAVQNISGNNRLAGAISIQSGGSSLIFQSDAGLLTLGAISSATGARTPTFTGSGSGLVSGIIADGAGTVAVVKSGSGTWTFGGVNSYTGSTTVNAGTLALGAADRIANGSALILNGGTFATGGFNETLGALTLSNNASINFGSGTSSLTFAGLGTLTAGTTLTITNWTQGVDRLFIGTSASLTASQLAQIKFNGTAAQQLNTGEVVPVTSASPTVASVAAASPGTITGTSATLFVLGTDDGGEANLTYTWAVTAKPGGAADPTFSINASNAAKNTAVTFSQAGSYTFTATIQDGSGLTTTSSVTVNVVATFAGIAAASGSIASGTSIAVGGADQFGNAMAIDGTVSWSTNAGSITQNGVFTAPTNGATSATITATVGSATHTTTVSIVAGRGWYKADTTGASLIDSSGNGNHGTLSGLYGYVSGRSGLALNLSGGAGDLPDGIVAGLTDFTIASWVYLNANPSWARIFDFGTGTSAYMFLTNNPGGANQLRFAITTTAGSGEQVINAPAIPLNTWTHVAVTLVGNVGTIYVNGVAVGTNANITLRPANLGTTTNNYLGDSQYSSDAALSGRLDDFRILGTGLNAAGIAGIRDLWQAPTLANAATATPSTVEGATTTNLSVLGASGAGEAGLSYTWSVLGTPPGSVLFNVNGNNAAKDAVATFAVSGTYQLLVTITNAAGASVQSTVTVTVTVPPLTATVTSAAEAWGVGSHTLQYTFDLDVGPQDWASLIDIASVDGTHAITPTGFSYDAATRTLTVTLPPASTIADDNYRATLSHGSILSADHVLNFFMLGGDTNGDRAVNFDDLLALARNYNGTGKTFADGDFDGDGAVGFNDLLVLAKNYNKSLAASFSNVAIAAVAETTTAGRRTRAGSAVLADV